MSNVFKILKSDKPGSVGLLLRIAIPLIITTSSASIMQFTDRMFLSWYSADALAACLPAGLISFSMVSFFMGTCGYTSVFVANYYGQKRYARLSVALWQGVLVGAFFGVIIAALVPLGLFLIGLSAHAPEVKILEKHAITTKKGRSLTRAAAFLAYSIGCGLTFTFSHCKITTVRPSLQSHKLSIFPCRHYHISVSGQQTDLSKFFTKNPAVL